MFCARRVLPLLALFAVAGCDKKTIPTTAAPPPGMPPMTDSPAALPANHKLEHPPTTELPPNHPAMPPGHPGMEIDPNAATPGEIPFDPRSVIAGVLRLDDKVKAKVKEGDAIFLVARQHDPAGGRGPILAVKKLVAGKWPMSFQLDGRDAMMTGTKLGGKVVVSVTVDKDGDAITKNPGDVTGVSRALDLPAEKVVVTLDTVL